MDGGAEPRHPVGMADKPAMYWDHEQCAWVCCPNAVEAAVVDDLNVPEQSVGEQEPATAS